MERSNGSIFITASPTSPVSITVVALDGSGNFKTIQEAVNSFRDHMQV